MHALWYTELFFVFITFWIVRGTSKPFLNPEGRWKLIFFFFFTWGPTSVHISHPIKKPLCLKARKKQALRCLLLNCLKVKSKRADLEYVIDIFLGTESWLSPDINNGEMFPSRYTIFRKDRSTSTYGGGVFQPIKNDLIVTHRNNLDTNCEIIWTHC